MSITARQRTNLNKMNKASQDVSLGDVINNLGSLSDQSASSVQITGGTLNGVIFGDEENNSLFESDGTLLFSGSATVFDDLRVTANQVTLPGINSPVWGIYKNDGTAISSASSAYFAYPDIYGIISHTVTSASLSVEFWLRTERATVAIFQQSTLMDIYLDNRDLGFKVSSDGYAWNTNLNLNQTYHIVYTILPSASTTNVSLYVNGSLFGSRIYNSVFSLSSGSIQVGRSLIGNLNYYKGYLDDLLIYNKELTSTQVSQRYNSGSGTSNMPTGITESTDVIAKYMFDDTPYTGSFVNTTSNTSGSLGNIISTGITQLAGLINPGVSVPSVGVSGLIFPPDTNTEVFFNVQLPHDYKIGSNIDAHVHWSHKINGSGSNIVWGLEYLWTNIGSISSNTTIVKGTCAVGELDKHEMSMIAGGVSGSSNPMISGSGKNISSMLMCRLFREGLNQSDNFGGDAYLMEFDFHYEKDTIGSRSIYSK